MVFFIFLFPFPFLGVFHLVFRFSPLSKKHTKVGDGLHSSYLICNPYTLAYSSIGRASGC